MRKFDVDAINSGLDQYWSSLSNTSSTFVNAPNVLPNPDLDAGATGFTASNNTIINFVTNSEGNNVFRIIPTGTAVAIRSTAIYSTFAGEEWLFECRVRATVPVATPSSLVITAEVFTGGAGAANITLTSSNIPTDQLTEEWVTLSGTYTVQSPRDGVRIRVFLDATATTGEIEVDNFRMSRKDGFEVGGQVQNGVSGISFESNPLIGNRNIARGGIKSILISDNDGLVLSDVPINDFSISLLMQANTSDVWLFKVALPTADIGVRINSDTSIELIWTVETLSIDEDGNYSSSTQLASSFLVYSEDPSYVSITRVGGTVSMSLNGKVVTIEGNLFSFDSFSFGGGTGSALIDKIAYSTRGVQIKIPEYIRLFKNQKLDTVPRPEGFSTFSYLLDSSIPDVEVYDREDFTQMDDYQYLRYYNPFEVGVIKIDRRASLLIEYSLDLGESWETLPEKLKVDSYIPVVLFRHQDTSDEAFYVQIVNTESVSIPMAFYDTLITGGVYLPSEVGFGYYDADPGDFDEATLRLTSNESSDISTVELLAIVNDPVGLLNTDTGAPAGDWYINGVPGAITDLKPDQLYHLVFVSESPMPWVEIVQGHQSEIVGIGASDIAYTESDSYYIFNTFVGNPLITALEDIDVLTDGVSDSGEAASLLDLQWNK